VKRYLFRNSAGKWCVADETGVREGNTQILGDVVPLDFNTAINLSREYSDNADAAELAGDTAAEERWSTWCEQLEIWAARSYPRPGSVVIRRTATHDDAWPTFSEMTLREPAIAGGRR
jgi:hypothetical protein